LKSAIRIGLKPYEVDILTPHELNLMINSDNEMNKEESKAGIISAFYSAYFSRLKTLSSSDLEKVLDGIDKTEKQTMSDEDMLTVVKRFAKVGG
jgi:hypothetical protein